nr:hypothetical protein EUGRSUZ_F00363 [Ipomoea batatas]
MCIVACTRCRVGQQVTGVTRISSFAINSWTSGGGLKRRAGLSLVVSVSKGVCSGSGEQAGQVNHHSVQTDVVVRRNQRWALRAVNGLVEGPGAVSWALSFRVSDPDIGKLVVLPLDAGSFGTVGSAAVHTESGDGDIGGCQHYIDSVLDLPLRGKANELLLSQRFPERVALVKDLLVQVEGKRFLGISERVVLLGGFPPGSDGRLAFLRAGERSDEVGDYCSLGRLEFAIPDQVDRDFAGEQLAFVVLQKLVWLFLIRRENTIEMLCLGWKRMGGECGIYKVELLAEIKDGIDILLLKSEEMYIFAWSRRRDGTMEDAQKVSFKLLL